MHVVQRVTEIYKKRFREFYFRIEFQLRPIAAKETPLSGQLRKVVAGNPPRGTRLILYTNVVTGICADRNPDVGRDIERLQQSLENSVLIDDDAIAALKNCAHGEPVPAPRLEDVPMIIRVVEAAAELKLPHGSVFGPRLDLEVSRSRALIEPRHKSDFRIEVFSDIKVRELDRNKVVVVGSS